MKLFVSGAIAYDRILYFNGHFKEHVLPDKVHALSVSFDIESIDESFGGTGGNISYNLILLNTRPLLYGAVGDDSAKYDAWIQKLGLDTSTILHAPGTLTSQAHIMTDRDNNQITGFHQGAGQVPYTLPLPVDTTAMSIVAPAHPKNMLLFAEHYTAHGMKYIFDPGQQVPTFTQDDYRTCVSGAWMFVANDYEMALSLEKLGWSEEELYARVPIVITTLGEEGSRIHTEGTVIEVDKAPADVVTDPTGAGDAYRAGLLKGLDMDLSIRECAQLGATVASYAIEKQGTQNHTFTLEQIKQRYEKRFGDILPIV